VLINLFCFPWNSNHCLFLPSYFGTAQLGSGCCLPSRFFPLRHTAALQRPKDVRKTVVPLFKHNACSHQRRCHNVWFHGDRDYKVRRHKHNRRIPQRHQQRAKGRRTAKNGPRYRLSAKRFCRGTAGCT